MIFSSSSMHDQMRAEPPTSYCHWSTWAVLETARNLTAGQDRTGPHLLAVALRDTQGALLGHRGEGWGDARDPMGGLGGCRDKHLLWHIGLDELPGTTSASQAVALGVGDRIENAWGCRQKIYLDHSGERAGTLDVDRLHR